MKITTGHYVNAFTHKFVTSQWEQIAGLEGVLSLTKFNLVQLSNDEEFVY
jgi:hypothetical protein